MAEYIERDALMRNLKQFAPEHLTPLIEILIQKQPVADVVEVVRCKDCKNHNRPRLGYCSMTLCYVQPDDYCSYGER